MILNVLGFVSAFTCRKGGKMAKTTMKAQEVRVSRAQSVAQGQQVRPSVRSRDGHGLLACCATLSIWQAAYTPQKW